MQRPNCWVLFAINVCAVGINFYTVGTRREIAEEIGDKK